MYVNKFIYENKYESKQRNKRVDEYKNYQTHFSLIYAKFINIYKPVPN